MESPCVNPKNLKSGYLVTEGETEVLSQNMGNNLLSRIRSDLQDVSMQNLSREVKNTHQGNQSRNRLPHLLIGLMKEQVTRFYQFSQDKRTREEFLKRIQFSPDMRKVLAVNQPNWKELNSIMKNEIGKNGKLQYHYIALQEKVLCELTVVEKHKKIEKLVDYIPEIRYEFRVLMLFLQDMLLHKYIISINFEGNSDGISNDIPINYRGRITRVKAHTADNKIGYSQLFFSGQAKKRNTFSVNKQFSLFNERLEKDIRYFIIYTNADLDLTEENKLKQGRCKQLYPLKISGIDFQKKKYKILRNCSCINGNGLYQFTTEETTGEKLLSLLKLPPSLQKEKEDGRLSDESEKEIKEKFLSRLIFELNQLNTTELNSIIRDRVKTDNESNNVPYNCAELYEIALRWSKSHEVGPITQRIMKEIFENITNNQLSYQNIQNRDISQEIYFDKSVVGKKETSTFHQFLDFLIKGEGTKYLKVLRREGINLASMSCVLNGAGNNSVEFFKELYDLWFDEKENKTQYLKILEQKEINLSSISSMYVYQVSETTLANQSKHTWI